MTNDIQITNQLFFPLPILSYVAPEEVEQSAFGDVARILQVELLDIPDPFGIGAWLKFSSTGSEDCEDHEDFQTCKALNWSAGLHSGFEHLAL